MATTVNVTSSPGGAYTWGTASFAWNDPDGGKTWDTVYPVGYTLSVGEGWATADAWSQGYSLNRRESWHAAELWSQASAHNISEAWRINEGWADIWLPMLHIFEGWTTVEAPVKSISMPFAEGWMTAETAWRMPKILKADGWAADEAMRREVIKMNREGWATAELASRLTAKIRREAFQATDNQPVWSVILAALEAWSAAETYHEITEFNYRAIEHIACGETSINNSNKPFSESFTTADFYSQNARKGLGELLAITEAQKNTAQFQRMLLEALHTVDAIASVYHLTQAEAFFVVEAYLRNANAVLSDIAFGTGDLSLEAFLNLNSPVGYTPFTKFVPGELEYQKALIALVLTGPLTTGRPQITNWQLTVDVPDQRDSGTCAIPAANTFVPFNVRFFVPPEVLVQLRGGSTGTPDITRITDEGFYVQIQDSDGQLVTGTIVWSADGY